MRISDWSSDVCSSDLSLNAFAVLICLGISKMLRRIYTNIAGGNASYSFEHRVFNLTSFIIMTFGIQAAVINYQLGLHIVTVWLAVSGAVVSAVRFYLSRHRQCFPDTIIFIFQTANTIKL